MKKDKKITKIISEGINDLFYVWKEEIKNVFKDSGVVIFFLIVPLAYPVMYSLIYNPETVREVKVVAVDQSNSAYSREFIRRVDATPDVNIISTCTTMSEAQTMLDKKEAFGILLFPTEFSKELHSGRQATVSIYSDMSLLLYYKAILLSATEVSLDMGKEITARNHSVLTSNNFQETAIAVNFQKADIAISYESVSLFNPSNGFASFLLPAVLMLVIQQTLVLGIGMLGGTAREQNRLHHLIPENSRFHGTLRVVLGKSLAYFIIYTVVSLWTLAIVPKIFAFPNISENITLLTFLLPYLLACIFFAMTLSAFMRTREAPMMIFVFLSVILLFLSGISWPKEAFPAYWRVISDIFPSTPGIKGYVLIKSCGATINEVAREYRLLWLQTGFYFITTCIVYRRQILHVERKIPSDYP